MSRFTFLPKFTSTQYAVIAVVILAGGGWYFFSGKSDTTGQTITLQKGDFFQQVAVAGEVKPAQNVDLAFEQSGRVSGVYASVGQVVSSGTVLAALSSGDLAASVSQKEAALQAQQAKLEGLKAGAQPEDIAASLAAVEKAKQDLANMYTGISDKLADAFGKGTDAVRVQLSPMFSGADTTDPQLSYSTTDSQSAIDASSARVQSRTALTDWQTDLSTISPYSDVVTLEKSITKGLAHLGIIRALTQEVINTLTSGTNLSAANLASYKAAATIALSETNAAITSLNNVAQDVASQKIAIQQLHAQYELKKAGATSHDIAAQQAAVDGAAADVANARAQLSKMALRAPFTGTVTSMDAKVGQVVSPSTPVISMISNGAFQIESYVPEVNIALIRIGNSATATLDAYGDNESFAAKVVSIDPASTLRDGVSTYRIVLQFSGTDNRVKAGMTANVSIVTLQKKDVLSLPQALVIYRDGKAFVQVLVGDATEEREVTVGEVSSLGEIEILSGLSAGDTVVLTTI